MADQSLGASEPTALEHAIEQLYAVPLADFMTTRAVLVAQARAAPNRPLAQQIGKLRKPSVAAALLNALIRARPDLVADLDSVERNCGQPRRACTAPPWAPYDRPATS